MKILFKLLCVLCVQTTFSSCGGTYESLKDIGKVTTGKHSKTNSEDHQQFRKEFRAEFERIWKVQKNLGPEFQAAQAKTPNLLFKQYVVDTMKASYKMKFMARYPSAALAKLPNQLEEKANTEVMYYIDEGTGCGPCWLCCSGVK